MIQASACLKNIRDYAIQALEKACSTADNICVLDVKEESFDSGCIRR